CTTRTFSAINVEIQTGFSDLVLIKRRVGLQSANWDYAALASGLAATTGTSKQRFDEKKVAAKVEKAISVEPSTWAEEGTLFQIEINFAPNQDQFPQAQYA